MTNRKNPPAALGMLAFFVFFFTIFACMFAIATEAHAETLPNTTITVNGMDGVITLKDGNGDSMTVNASCARVIVDSGAQYLEDIHKFGVTASDAYQEACF